jgi:ubiquinone/menaquinone biosynthesis C-methylase UbiE
VAHRRDKSVTYHNRVARQYDAIYDDVYWRFHDEITWRSVKPHLPGATRARCLDLGCGTGKWGLKLIKSGYSVTFVDHAPAMIGEVRRKLAELGAKAAGSEAVVADIMEMPEVPSASFALTLAMGDPISICSDPARAAAEMFRCSAPGGIVIATADNKLSALDAYVQRGDLEGLGELLRTGRTRWLTRDSAEQFELHTFTPAELRRLFERAGFEVLHVAGKTILPVRENRGLLEGLEGAALRRLVEQEMALEKDPLNASRAGHLQITARRPPQPEAH